MQFIEGQTLAAVIRDLRQLTGLEMPNGTGSAGAVGGLVGELASRHWVPVKRPGGDPQATGSFVPTAQPRPPGEQPLPDGRGSDSTSPVAVLSTERSTRSPAFFRTVAKLGVQAAEALEHAHQQGVIHRDIKPANLLVDGRGGLWIADFGLAHCQGDAALTMTGDLVGTLRYMSPEQALAKRVLIDHRTDVYSLGATLYEMLTLRPAFDGRDRHELLRQIAFEEPQSPRRLNKAIPTELETIVLKALEKNPADRFATAQELGEDLERFLKDEPIQARRTTLRQRSVKWARRNRAVVLTAAGALAVLMVLAVVGLAISNLLISRERQEAVRQRDEALAQRRLVRRAVDTMFTQVVEKWLSHRPSLEPSQREFLQEALEFYQEFAKERSLDPDVRLEIALTYNRVADIQKRLLDNAKAEDAYHQAVTLLDSLVTEFPAEPRYRSALADSYVDYGFALGRAGRLNEAVGALHRTVRLYKELVDEFPNVPNYQLQLAKHLTSLGKVLQKAGRHRESADAYRESVESFEKLPPELANTSEPRGDVCIASAFLSRALRASGEWQQADEWLERAVTIMEKLAADFPCEVNYKNHLVGLLREKAGSLQDAQPQEAERAIRKAIAVAEIAAAQSANPAWQQVISALHGELAELLKTAKNTKDRKKNGSD